MVMNIIKHGYLSLLQILIPMNSAALFMTVGEKLSGRITTTRWVGMESVQMELMLLKELILGKLYLNLRIQTTEKPTRVMSI